MRKPLKELMSKPEYAKHFSPYFSCTARQFKSINCGLWRLERPVVEPEKCNGCGICARFCPIEILRANKEEWVVDLRYCKGCGICANECPKEAIAMVAESTFSKGVNS